MGMRERGDTQERIGQGGKDKGIYEGRTRTDRVVGTLSHLATKSHGLWVLLLPLTHSTSFSSIPFQSERDDALFMKTTTFKLRILSCRNLTPKDQNGLADPFVIIRLGSQKLQTKVQPKTLHPQFDQEFILEFSSNVQDHLVLTVWDKDLLRREFMGYMEVSLVDLIATLKEWEDPLNHPEWFPLCSRHAKDVVTGDICVQFGLVGYIEPTLRHIATSVHQVHHASLISTEDPAEDLYFNHSFEPDEEESDTITEFQHTEMVGILLMELVGANDLPFEKNTLKTTFNCDPFAVVSYGKTTFRTKIVRHSLNPQWNQVLWIE
jgi:phosphatidylserine decarboxylase